MFAVIFTYSFDTQSSVYLFDDEEKAKEFIKNSYEKECMIEEEENGYAITAGHEDDWSYAYIKTGDYFDESVCEYHLTGDVYKK